MKTLLRRTAVILLIPTLILITSPAALAQASSTVLVQENAQLGKFLSDSRGFTLYLFKNDKPGESTCYDACAQTWPPLIASGNLTLPSGVAGKLDVHTRKDGTKQVTYNGVPLYFYAPDTSPSDTKGQGRGNVWFVLAPQLASSQLPKTGEEAVSNYWWLVALGGLGVLGLSWWLRRGPSHQP